MNKKKGAYLLLAAVMLFLFNAPILSSANKIAFVKGIPVLYLYLFSAWILCIFSLIGITLACKSKKQKHE